MNNRFNTSNWIGDNPILRNVFDQQRSSHSFPVGSSQSITTENGIILTTENGLELITEG